MNKLTLVKEVVHIAQAAGKAILDIYHQSEGIEIIKKADNSPLTIADKTANDIICQGLEAFSVQYPIISEENKQIPYAERKNYEYAWLVDPLDGTKEFIKRNGEFTVNIALIHHGKIILGVVYTPVLKETYWATKGEGAYFEKDGKVEKLTPPPFRTSDKMLKLVCSRSHLNEDTKTFVKGFEAPVLVSKGSSLKFLLLAKGEAHIYPRLAPTMEWDTGAAQIILEEAGGKVLHFDTKQPLEYNKADLLNPFFVAYGNINI